MKDDFYINGEIIRDSYNRIVFDSAEDDEIYIVGGFIRDIFLGRKVPDRDYVVKGDFQKAAERISIKLGCRLTRIGKKNFLRILTKDGITLDFTPMNEDIEKDLSGRDFTVNALAWSPETGLIDLFNGIDDIAKGLIRIVKKENLDNDPARILRAYRLSGETSFKIEETTRVILKKMAHKISEVKTERITLEFFKILNLEDPFPTLRAMHDDTIMNQIICIPNNKIQLKLHKLNEVSGIVKQRTFKNLLEVNKIFSQGLSNRGLLRLEVLLEDTQSSMFSLSSKIQKRLCGIESAGAIMPKFTTESRERLYSVFDEAGDAALDFLVINNMLEHVPDLREFDRIKRKSILSAEEIIDILKIGEGVILGQAKEVINKAEFCLKIKTKSDAIELLLSGFDVVTS